MKTDAAQGAQVAPMNRGEVRPTVEKELTTGDVGRTEEVLSEKTDRRIRRGPLPVRFWLAKVMEGKWITASTQAKKETGATPTDEAGP